MIKKTLFFSHPAILSLRNGQLMIRFLEIEKGNVVETIKQKAYISKPIEDIGMVVLEHRQITITTGLLSALMENNCAVVGCDERGMPSGLFMPLDGNTVQTERFRYQIDASLPLKKQLWQQTIKMKIANQTSVLEKCVGCEVGCMKAWIDKVKSGDAENLEARAAVYYWKNLFPQFPNFVRSREGTPPNNLLNYGYAILRAVVARALVSSGLLPALGIHHRNRYNAYCLADDIMEPFRPFVDELVVDIMARYEDISDLDTQLKAELLTIPTLDVVIEGKKSPLMVGISQTTASLYKCFAGQSRKISYPVL